MSRKKYVCCRLFELACIAENRQLDPVEVDEEKRLVEELSKLSEEE